MKRMKNETKADRSKDELLREAREIEEKDFKMRQEGFVAEYNKLVQKYDVHIVAVPQLVPAGGIFGIGATLTIQPVPKQQNGG